MDTTANDLLEARKVTSIAMKNEKFLESKAQELETALQNKSKEETENFRSDEELYLPTSNLLWVRDVAYASQAEENLFATTSEPVEKPENIMHSFLYGAVLEGKAAIDPTMEEKKMDKHG